MPWSRVAAAAAVGILVSISCSGGSTSSPLDEPAVPALATASTEDSSGSTSSPLDERHAWCARIQAVWDEEAETRTLDSDSYGLARWQAAGLIYSSESILYDYSDDEELTAAIARGRSAFELYASPRTMAALEVARDASKAPERLRQRAEEARNSYAERTAHAVARWEPVTFPPDTTEAWLRAGMALEGLIQAAQIRQDAEEALITASVRVSEALGTYGPAYDPAQAIYDTALSSGDWETMMHDIETALATARVAARRAEEYAITRVELDATSEGLIEAGRAAERTHETASDTTAEDTVTGADKAYLDFLGGRGVAVAPRIHVHVPVDDVIRNFEKAAWNAARIAVGIDTEGTAAFRDSIQESCR